MFHSRNCRLVRHVGRDCFSHQQFRKCRKISICHRKTTQEMYLRLWLMLRVSFFRHSRWDLQSSGATKSNFISYWRVSGDQCHSAMVNRKEGQPDTSMVWVREPSCSRLTTRSRQHSSRLNSPSWSEGTASLMGLTPFLCAGIFPQLSNCKLVHSTDINFQLFPRSESFLF